LTAIIFLFITTKPLLNGFFVLVFLLVHHCRLNWFLLSFSWHVKSLFVSFIVDWLIKQASKQADFISIENNTQ